MLIAAAGWLLVAWGGELLVRYAGLIAVSIGSFCALLTFWTLPASTAILTPEARPAGIALINCVGIGGGSVAGPLIVGYLESLTGSFTAGIVYVIAMLVMGVVCIALCAGAARTRETVVE